MGFDVYGLKPRSPGGEYFRASIWAWHPLWELACDVAEAPDEIRRTGYHNGGGEIPQSVAECMADGLDRLDDETLARELDGRQGATQERHPIVGWMETLEARFPGVAMSHGSPSPGHVRGFAAFARASGGFSIQ